MISMKMNFRFAIIASLFIVMCSVICAMGGFILFTLKSGAHLAVKITEVVRSFLEPSALHEMTVNLLTVKNVASLQGGDLAVETREPVALERS